MRVRLYLLIFITYAFFGFGQFQGASKDKLEAVKIGFLTEKMGLSSAQAAAFWPIYLEYTARRRELKAKQNVLIGEHRIDNLPEELIVSEIKQLYQLKGQEAQLEEEYTAKFLKILTAKQVAKWYHAEREFLRILLKKSESK